ncbi:MAG: CvpA family protein [Clostridia bacterium]|nr:CvpA family protein [Clostridia bacterium]
MLVDIILVAIIVLLAVIGRKRGLFKTLAGVFSFAISTFLVFAFSKEILDFFKKTSLYDTLYKLVFDRLAEQSGVPLLFGNTVGSGLAESFTNLILKILLAILIFILVKIIIKVIDKIFHLPVLKSFNRLGGLIFGLVQGFIIIYVIFAVWGSATLFAVPEALENSTLAKSMFENNLLMIIFA